MLPDCTLVESKDGLELASHHATAVMSRFWSAFRVHLEGVEPRSESSNPLAHTASHLSTDEALNDRLLRKLPTFSLLGKKAMCLFWILGSSDVEPCSNLLADLRTRWRDCCCGPRIIPNLPFQCVDFLGLSVNNGLIVEC